MRKSSGFALLVTLLIIIVLSLLAISYFTLTNIDVTTTKAKVDQTSGFYSAEAGLNLRGDTIRNIFETGAFPVGTSPTVPCRQGGTGSGSFACQVNNINGREVDTYVLNRTVNPGGDQIVINSNEVFGGLSATEFRYSVFSESYPPAEVSQGADARPEARLELIFRSRLVPLFQFAAFYNKDLEILPGPDMVLGGPVHVNGDLYTNANNTLTITGQVTVSRRTSGTGCTAADGGCFYRRRKNDASCGGTVRVADESGNLDPVSCSGLIPQSTLDAWGGRIETGLETLDVPDVSDFNIGDDFWDNSDLRLVYNVATGLLTVRQASEVPDAALSATFNGCGAYLGTTNSFYNRREGKTINLVEINVQAMLACIGANPTLLSLGPAGGAVGLADVTDGGIGVFITIEGGNAATTTSSWGVRLRNGANLSAANNGLTVISDQAMYVLGSYNDFSNTNANWRPAAFMGDSLNVLSNGWNLATDGINGPACVRPAAANTRINAAFLSGTDLTGGADGVVGQNSGNYNGGLENYPRFHENWGGRTLTYRGSFVSLGEPQHVRGRWDNQCYSPPIRDWGYETNFNNATQLPPLTPKFVYLRQDLFLRDFER